MVEKINRLWGKTASGFFLLASTLFISLWKVNKVTLQIMREIISVDVKAIVNQ